MKKSLLVAILSTVVAVALAAIPQTQDAPPAPSRQSSPPDSPAPSRQSPPPDSPAPSRRSPPPDSPAKAPSPQQVKKQRGALDRELNKVFQAWIEQDVAYIITDEERAAWKQLNTAEERESFIEQFWLRRDPTPDTPENEYKEEHYRRIAYANEHFASGVPGWKTDRGRIYIKLGPPDEIEAHPSGGSYQRPAQEGGGITSTYPFETWRYRYIGHAGQEISLEFVDETMSGEYHITFDPSAKDALLYVPNAGLTTLEAMGQSSKTARFTNPMHLGASMFGTPAGEDEFSRMETLVNVMKAPPVKFRDLAAVVDSKIT